MTSLSKGVRSDYLVDRVPFFYGWVIWFVSTIGLMATMPGQSATVSLFIDSFIADFNLDRTTVSGLYGLGTFVASFVLTYVGRQVDVRGNRIVGVVISGLFALALIWMSLITGPIGLFVGFMAIRGLGQGSLSLVNITAIAKWFRSRRGRMTSLALVLFSLFQAAYVPWLQRLLAVRDWREVWMMLAVFIIVTILPLTWILMRNQPEQHGLYPDGMNAVDSAKADAEDANEVHFTFREAIRTPAFWVYTIGRMVSPAWGTGLIFHQLSMFGLLDHGPEIAAQTYGLFSILSAGTSVLAGYLLDRWNVKAIALIQLGSLMILMLLAIVMRDTILLILYALMFAMAQGFGGIFDSAAWANLFGREHLGSIRGLVGTMSTGGTAIGPILFGISFDQFGTYTPVLIAGIVVTGIGVLSILWVKPPHKVYPDKVYPEI